MNHFSVMRFSLLLSLGLVSVACGGNTANPGEGTGGSGTGKKSTTKATPTCTTPTADDRNQVGCAEGYVYRPVSNRCGAQNGSEGNDAAPPVDPLPRVEGFVDCTADASICEAYQYGYCERLLGPSPSDSCRSGCAVDADCGEGGSCRCAEGESVGTCSFDSCDSDAECEPGYHCAALKTSVCGPGLSSFRCQTPDDECLGNEDCALNEVCSDDGEGTLRCGPSPACGRPFLVAHAARLPPVTSRSDWSEIHTPRLDHLSLEERAALARHWTTLGQMEHASIAAFARFSLQLLALGAPADLVEACTAALADETAHAKLCFGIASAYAGRSIGPGPLDVSNSLELTSLSDIVDLVIAEGCIGETSAALEALEAAESAADPVIRAAYTRIAADEQRHAELAFRFVRWALARGGTVVEQRVQTALLALPSARGAQEVVRPCLEALIDVQLVA
jgi:hypothetical protein